MSNFQAVNFFKVYYSRYTSETMCIPPNTVVLPKGSMCATATLRNSKNKCWHVEVKEFAGKMYFERGWTKFVDENPIDDGDILVFTYVGSSLFDVTVMGPNGCMKSVEEVEEEEEEEEDDNDDGDYCEIEGDDSELKSEEEEEIEVLGTSNKKGKNKGCREETSSKEVEDVEFYIARNVNQLNPCFVVKGRKNRNNELYVPTDVTKNYNLVLEDEEEITFIDPLGREMIGKVFKWKDGRICIHGWKSVCMINRVNLHRDVCICEFLLEEQDDRGHTNRIKVHIRRGNYTSSNEARPRKKKT
ncbi:hypothetical protein CCACVL1_17089 [Corchorus capsularis]|uniref:TF-B3 domain-containing protein n=1 Tax=Corchorus capsularis TaxID=210143 RepID=A0A1R3HU13_COCAP|nr:hypothetical protein CCACVL1_17089 [Corchorus capsularis]